jgi:hypothetical protein
VVVSCLVLNGHAVQGRWLLGHLPSIGDPEVWLPGSWAHAELGHKDELDQVGKWKDHAHPWPLRWDKRTIISHV